ncbi:MAG: aldo/keto reductase [Proteobacteria bacterium]|nr:aldo/keto reductase [Pseudomonadota bacterium]TDJ38198.1 MAG: aldo/keto reductase [Gammaproteobacteria bacterium]
MTGNNTTRRDFLALMSALGLTGADLAESFAQEQMPSREIPGTNEWLPIIGLGSSKPVSQIADRGTEPIAAVLRALVASGGSVVDTWPRNPANDEAFGRIINEPDLRESLFVASKIDKVGKDAGLRQFRQTQRLYQRETLDLVQIFSLTDLDTQWRNLKDWKASGKTRYIGATVANASLYEQLESFLRRERPDFVQINYSITERGAEERMLPLCQDLGVAVIINRPFMNGDYFQRLGQRRVPGWAADFDCESWAQFSLKYILPQPAITCVLTETSNPAHMVENSRAAFGRMPDDSERNRMKAVIDQA